MSERLEDDELAGLIQAVFHPRGEDRALALLVDLPDEALPDHPGWRWRRELALAWSERLAALRPKTGLECRLVLYRNVRTNNADLPETAWLHGGGVLPVSADALEASQALPFEQLLATQSIFIALTELSATAPLKLSARRHGFRAATMPGFSPEMLPALRLDYLEISRRVSLLKDLLDRAVRADFLFRVDDEYAHRLTLDLRHRTAHASSGLLHEPGQAGNLPSGEAYVVPYEGEREGDPSRSAGELPVQLGDEVVVYRIERNQAVGVVSQNSTSAREAERLRQEPAYGNLAELGLGVLSDFGVEPCGQVLLDEKLGLHIAFGRSDHFGGQVGAAQFTRPEAVVHIDRVYLPSLQPRVRVPSVELELEDGTRLCLMRDGRYAIEFS